MTGNVVNTIAKEVNKEFENESIDSNNETEYIKNAVVARKISGLFGLIGALLLLLIVIKNSWGDGIFDKYRHVFRIIRKNGRVGN